MWTASGQRPNMVLGQTNPGIYEEGAVGSKRMELWLCVSTLP
jgi:hypothetical protein